MHPLDRLGSFTRDVFNLVRELHGRGASLRVLESEAAGEFGRLVVAVLCMVANMKLKFIRGRQGSWRSVGMRMPAVAEVLCNNPPKSFVKTDGGHSRSRLPFD